MSWRSCVVCVVGDLGEDAFAFHWWTEANVLELLKDRKIKLVKKVDKSVTHLICSRSAYRSRVPEVVSIKKIQNRRIHRKPQIVTYDWLEDSIDAKKPIQGTDKYDPGKPRDVNGMVAAWKETKFSVKARANGPAESIRKKTTEETGQGVPPTSLVDANKSETNLGQKNQDIADKMTIAPLSTKPSTTAHTTCKPKKELLPEKISEVYRDETDNFPYKLELTPGPTSPQDETYVIEVKVATNYVSKQFRFQAFRYKKGKEIHANRGGWLKSAKEALDKFVLHFRRKAGYSWDKRLLGDGERGGNGGRWLYKAPMPGMPTGAVPPEYTPGHPKYVKPVNLLPNATQRPAGPGNTIKRLDSKKTTTSTTAINRRAVSDLLGQVPKKAPFPSSQHQKRKIGEHSSSEHRNKVQKTTQVHDKTLARTKHSMLF